MHSQKNTSTPGWCYQTNFSEVLRKTNKPKIACNECYENLCMRSHMKYRSTLTKFFNCAEPHS